MTVCTMTSATIPRIAYKITDSVMTYANIPNKGYVCTVILGSDKLNGNQVVYTIS